MSDNEIFKPSPVVRIANRHSFSAEQYWGERSSSDCQWIMVLSGTLIYRYAKANQIEASTGDLMFIPAGEAHLLTAKTDGSLAGFHGEWFDQGSWTEDSDILSFPWRRVTRMPSSTRVVETMMRMATLFGDFLPFKVQLLSGRAADVLLHLASEWVRHSQPTISPRTTTMLEWIRSRMPEPIDRNAIADHFGLTPAYVNQVFKKELGLTPGAVVRRERCALAYQLLQEGRTVSKTAEVLGFADPFHFSRVFTKVYGISPSQARP